jgi:hypothetical protein
MEEVSHIKLKTKEVVIANFSTLNTGSIREE